MTARRLVIGLSGASGAIYGQRTLELLAEHAPELETHLVVSVGARSTIEHELGIGPERLLALATHAHDPANLGAPISSGSFRTDGMIVAPCSMASLGAIAHSHAQNLLVRAADVTLKERRPLVLLVRETPLHRGHLRLMLEATENGATVMPPVPAFYGKPSSLLEMVDHTVVRALDQVGVSLDGVIRRWGPDQGERTS